MKNRFRWSRAISMARKEIRHILRDPFTLGAALGLPVLFVIFFGYAIDFNVKDVHLVAADRDHSRASRQLLEVFTSSGYFKLTPAPLTGTGLQDLNTEKAKAAVLIEPRFGKAVGAGEPSKIQVILDGTDSTSAGIILNYLLGIQQAATRRLYAQDAKPGLDFAPRYLFNPELNSKWFVIPGLAVVVIAFLSILLTALTVAREWESGSMEMLLVTPVRPLEIILGKLAPYLALVLISVMIIFLVARFQFHIPFRGNHGLFFIGCLLFIIPSLAQGIVISVVTRQQLLAMQLAFLSGMLPSLLLSGFIFPIESMPKFFQILTMILAPRWFIQISRGIFLKGAGVQELAVPFLILLALNILLVSLALRAFKTDLEK